ncbi:hypothetical protein N7486_002184 [Penicillium sp. IBT 16267x]|nr:hypothetical protein N7486_002184 [Penicillium sp. IBT 16267x]
MGRYFGLRGSRLHLATVLLVVCPAYICFGYNLAVAGGLLTLPSFVEQFPQLDTINTTGAQNKLNSNIQGAVSALFTVGGFFGALSTIVVGDWLGRRRIIFIASAVVIVGAALMSSSYSLGQLIVARLVQGMATGAITATVPVWQSELAGSAHRGAHVVAEGLFVAVGITASQWIDFGFYYLGASSVSWRVPLVIQVPLAVMVMAIVFFMPESPRWHLRKNNVEEAQEIIGILRDADPRSERVLSEVAIIQASLEMLGSATKLDLIRMGEKRNLHRLLLGICGQSFGQLCGINSLTFYATIIFQQRLHLAPTPSRLLGSCMTFVQIIGALSAVMTIDRLGRRKLMMISASGMGLSMTILAITASLVGDHPAMIVAVVFFYVYNMFYPFGFLGLPFLYSTEVAPPHLRAKISGLSNAMTWLFNFVVVEVTPSGFDNIQYRYYIIWAIINFIIVVTVYFLFPETNGRSLEEMDEIFKQSKSIFDPPRIARAWPKHVDQEREEESKKQNADMVENSDVAFAP